MAMFTVRDFSGATLGDALDPPHRLVNYGDNPAVITVATRIRQAWLCRPEAVSETGVYSDLNNSFGKVARIIQTCSAEELEAMRNPDTQTVHTPYRDMLYWAWNHVFWDVSKFLAGVNCNTGTFNPPAHHVVGIEYPHGPIPSGKLKKVAEMELEDNIMLAAAYLTPGAKIRLLVGQNSELETLEDTNDDSNLGPAVLFDASEVTDLYNESKVHWMRRDQTIQVFVGQGSGDPKQGLAGVFVYGKYVHQEEAETDEQMEEGTAET